MNYITFHLNYIFIALIKMALSTGFSTIIAIKKDIYQHTCEVSTHILVGLGSCLFTLTSVHMRDKYNSPNADPARICAQIVSGIGFLGSATIFKSNNYVKGINTAANLWISAAVSMAIGCDLWELAAVTSGFTIIVLLFNNRYNIRKYGNRQQRQNIKRDIENGLELQYSSVRLDTQYGDKYKYD